MKTYSPERKAAVIARMMPPHNQSVVQIARSEGIPTNTLYAWRSQAGIPVNTDRILTHPAKVKLGLPQLGWKQNNETF
ncbi:transposase [Symbiopectobacterium purcellii]|uniref:transposase n=1 Tax=Symbiopectobacterium purcellii TaxID=2871826 RepID=UPI003F8589B1